MQVTTFKHERIKQTIICISSDYSTVLRTVPTIVIAHTFSTSRDTGISYG